MELDVQKLTIADLEEIENYGVSLGDLAKVGDLDTTAGEFPPAKVLAVFAWLLDRDKYPTIADARQANINDLMAVAATIEAPASAVGE